MQYKEILERKHGKILVWGCGYIGLSTIAFFAKKKIHSIGFDIDKEKIKSLNNGKINIYGLQKWLGFDVNKLNLNRFAKGTNDLKELKNMDDIICHFVCVPTEKFGYPNFNSLKKVIKNIFNIKSNKFNRKQCIIIESTLTPNTTDKIIRKIFKSHKRRIDEYHFAVAPRRDWFENKDKTLETLDRVFGCSNENSNKIIKSILNIVTKNVHTASNYKVAEFVKSIENSYRHLEINYANELSLAYPDTNMREVLNLVGTKWNMNTYYPGFGTGGYCIPLSSLYVKQGAKNKKKLKILNSSIKLDRNINKIIAKKILKKRFKNILIMGLTYKADLKVHVLSPSLELIKIFKKKNQKFKIYDPLYKKKELDKIVGKNHVFKSNFSNYDCIILMVLHKKFKNDLKIPKLLKNRNLKFILNNTNFFTDHKNRLSKTKIKCIQTGEPNWI